ncbi:MAG: c-type cytochrome [Pyrinomonadaceae bacterium]
MNDITSKQRRKLFPVILPVALAAAMFGLLGEGGRPAAAFAQATPTPNTPQDFDQAAAIAKLRAEIKGRERESASSVFKNIQTPELKDRPAAQLLAIMEMGYARSLGVNCTHCHVPQKWESEDKPQKQIAREMSAMVSTINGDLLSKIKNLKGTPPTINCTTCHRGEIKPALNLPVPPKS